MMPTLQVHAQFAAQLSLATQQHDIPILRELKVENSGSRKLSKLRLELTSDPNLLQPRAWTIDQLSAGESRHIADRQIPLNGQLLLELREALRGKVLLRLKHGEEWLLEQSHSVELLARDEWGGWGSSPELLTAFVGERGEP